MSAEDRLGAVETRLTNVEGALVDIRTGQGEVMAQIAASGEQQREAIRAEGERVSAELGKVNAAVVQVSSNVVKLQGNVMKWAAAASLAGAVCLFIAVRALGF